MKNEKRELDTEALCLKHTDALNLPECNLNLKLHQSWVVSNPHSNNRVSRMVKKPSQISMRWCVHIDRQEPHYTVSVWKRNNRGRYWWAWSGFTVWALGIYLYAHYAGSLSFFSSISLAAFVTEQLKSLTWLSSVIKPQEKQWFI